MRWLAPELPLQVPVPWVACDHPLRVRHRLVRGTPTTAHDERMGHRLGQFLVALHGKPIGEAVLLGVPDGSTALISRRRVVATCWSEVVPRLPVGFRPVGRELLERISAHPVDTLVHGDLGPDHLLVHASRLHGVIDWTDAHVGDAALDLAWAMHGAAPAFAAGVLRAYAPSADLVERSWDWHRWGPWHEVLYGLDTDQPAFVESGLTGVLARLVTTRDAGSDGSTADRPHER